MFKFKLEFLLRYRKQKEELAMYELAQRIREAAAKEEELENIRDRSLELNENLKTRATRALPAPIFVMYKEYQGRLKQQYSAVEKQLARAEEKIEIQREALVQASVQRKIIEKYREKMKAAYDKAEAIKEQQSLEELATIARSRKTNEA